MAETVLDWAGTPHGPEAVVDEAGIPHGSTFQLDAEAEARDELIEAKAVYAADQSPENKARKQAAVAAITEIRNDIRVPGLAIVGDNVVEAGGDA